MEEWVDEAAEALDRVTRSSMADAFVGTLRIMTLSEPKGRSRYQACAMDVLLEAPGLEPELLSTEVVLDRRHWPAPGMIVRTRISRRRPRMIDADWDALGR